MQRPLSCLMTIIIAFFIFLSAIAVVSILAGIHVPALSRSRQIANEKSNTAQLESSYYNPQVIEPYDPAGLGVEYVLLSKKSMVYTIPVLFLILTG